MAEAITFQGAEGNELIGDVRGTGALVAVLLHGGGQTRHSWKSAAQDLAEQGLTAITLDLRGHGDSAWMENGHYRFVDYAADAAAVFRQIHQRFGTRPIAVGASLGGISSLLAEGEAEMSDGVALLSGLVLVDITPRMDPSGVNKIMSFMAAKMHDGFETVEEAADAVAAYLPHRARPKSLDGLRKNLREGPDGRLRWHWDSRFIDGPTSIGTDHGEAEIRLMEATRRLKCPVQLVRGGRSELVSEDHAREFLDMVPHARFVDVSEAGHMVAGDKNDIFGQAVLSFVQEIKAA